MSDFSALGINYTYRWRFASLLSYECDVFTGVEGGFDPDEEKYEYEEENKLVVLPQFHEISLEEIEEIPSIVRFV